MVLNTVLRLSPNINAGPMKGTSSIFKLYQISIAISVAMQAVTNLEPYVE